MGKHYMEVTMRRFIDFRSDTVTQPTREMRIAMMEAECGDDTLGDDPTVDKLERMSAEILGKEDAIFTLSGTMANQIAVMTMTRLGDEIIVGDESHIFNLEVGGIAALSGVQARPLKTKNGEYDLEELSSAIRIPGIQAPRTSMICLENTYNLNKGIPLGKDYVDKVSKIAKEKGTPLYLDGARIFNASTALGINAKELCEGVDAVMFCLTKGLCAPMGAMLAGSREFTERARWIRQRLGGGMRQAGCVAAAGVVAMEKMIARLNDDHENARYLMTLLQEIEPKLVAEGSARTNIVQLDLRSSGITAKQLVDDMERRGLKIKPIGLYACRMITHNDISKADIDLAASSIREILEA